VGENVGFKKGEEKRTRKKPRKSTGKIETMIYFPTYHVHVITPSRVSFRRTPRYLKVLACSTVTSPALTLEIEGSKCKFP
jgi:hypothetical protein